MASTSEKRSSFLQTVLNDESIVTSQKKIDDVTTDRFIANFMFPFDPNISKYTISRNIHAADVWVSPAPPLYFPVTRQGFATFVNLDGYNCNIREFLESSPYSLRKRTGKWGRNSTVTLFGKRVIVKRESFSCSGVTSCVYSYEKNSSPHFNRWNPGCDQYLSMENSSHVDATGYCNQITGSVPDELQWRKAKQVFFYAQNAFPIRCKHQNFINTTSNTSIQPVIREIPENRQRRTPNWTFKTGKPFQSSDIINLLGSDPNGIAASSRRPDFIGCAAYGHPNLRNHHNCSLVPLPPHLQGANPIYVERLVQEAKHGIFPTTSDCIGKCRPLPYTYSGKHCLNPAHSQEAPVLKKIQCKALYHYFFHSNPDGTLSWVIVVGIGIHNHTWPVARAPPSLARQVIRDVMSKNPQLTSQEVARNIEEVLGVNAPMNTIEKERYRLNCERYPFGRSLQALLAKQKTTFGDVAYIRSIVDERRLDKMKPVSEQVGVSVILCNEDLIKLSLECPRLGCDGTFGVVSSYDDLCFELNSVVMKHPVSGKVVTVMRQIASRKTVAARKLLFVELIRKMKSYGLPDPLIAPPGKTLCMATDFETTYSVALGHALREEFGSGNVMDYIRACCVGCDVHAKRILLEKCGTLDREIFKWAVGTRQTQSVNCVKEALSIMKGLGGKWCSFATWLEKNEAAYVLWFYGACSSLHGPYMVPAFWDTNACESMHARIKGHPKYLITNRRGMDLVEVVMHLEEMDTYDAKNGLKSNCSSGLMYQSKPEWRRSQNTKRRGKKRSSDGLISIGGSSVTASQPRSAKKRKSTATQGSRRQSNKDSEERLAALENSVGELTFLLKSYVNGVKRSE